MSEPKHVIIRVLSLLVGVVTIIGNSMVCHIIVRLKTMKTAINYIKLCLAILDTISGFLVIYYSCLNDPGDVLGVNVLTLAYNQSSILADVLCKISASYWLVLNVSPLLLMILAYERYKAIVYPFSRFKATKARLKWMLPLAWAIGLIYAIIDMLFTDYDENAGVCGAKSLPSWLNVEAYMSVFLVTNYIIPSVSIFVFYFRLIRSLRKRIHNSTSHQDEARQARRRANTKKVVCTVFIVTLAFYICCVFPLFAFMVLDIYRVVEVNTEFFHSVSITVVCINSSLNPFLYFIFVQSFRDGFRQVFMPDNRRCFPHKCFCSCMGRLQHSVDVQKIELNEIQGNAHPSRLLVFVNPKNNQDPKPDQPAPLENVPGM